MLVAMRLLMTAALIIACVSIDIDLRGAGPDTCACRAGLCRKDQLLRHQAGPSPAPQTIDLLRLRRLVQLAPADAYAWVGWAEQLRFSGAEAEGRRAIDHAIELAPAVAQIRMRRVNLCFEGGDKPCLLKDGRSVLSRTATFDGVLFSYYTAQRLPLSDVLSLGLPDDARSSRAWAIYLAANAPSIDDTLSTWVWLSDRGHADESTACRMTRELVSRRQFDAAWRIWSNFRTQAYRRTEASNLITNPAFQRRAAATPFDWELKPESGVHFNPGNGLEIEFDGTRNLSLRNVRQMLYLGPGPHRLVVDLEYDGLTTDQGPYVRLSGESPDSTWSVQTEMLKGSAPRNKFWKDFVVPGKAGPAWIQVERSASQKFENRIAGRLRIYSISLYSLGGSTR